MAGRHSERGSRRSRTSTVPPIAIALFTACARLGRHLRALRATTRPAGRHHWRAESVTSAGSPRRDAARDECLGGPEIDPFRIRRYGRWEAAYESQARSRIPEDLERELDARPAAKASFERLNSQNRYAILYRLADAKRAETRERRLAKFVEMLEAGKTIYP